MIIRRVPRDFVVTERLSEHAVAALEGAWRPRLGFVWFTLTKEGLTTPDACALLAKSVRVKPGAVAWAGLKDRHAVTEQAVSVRLGAGEPGSPSFPEAVEGRGWRACRIGFTTRAVTADDIASNAFSITVRRLQRRHTGVSAQRIGALSTEGGGSLLVLNYFGDQRFGSARHGAGFAARHLVRGEFESALKLLIATPARKDSGPWRTFTRLAANYWGDWKRLLDALPRRAERGAIEVLAHGGSMRDAFAALPAFTQQMCVEAYQSWLWNRAARALAERLDPGGLRADDDFGPMHFPRARLIDEDAERVSMPLPAPGIALHEPWGRHLLATLQEEGMTPDALAIPGLRRPAFGAAERPLFIRASAFSISDPEPDDLAGGAAGDPSRKGHLLLKRQLRFELPRGAYATVLLRALGQ